jgi:hypothetical protein
VPLLVAAVCGVVLAMGRASTPAVVLAAAAIGMLASVVR